MMQCYSGRIYAITGNKTLDAKSAKVSITIFFLLTLPSSEENISTPLCLFMLMIQSTPRSPPRLTSLPFPHLSPFASRTTRRIQWVLSNFPFAPPIIPARHAHTTLHAPCAESLTAVFACHSAVPRRKGGTTVIACA